MLEASFAAAVHVAVGDKIVVDGIDGTEVSMRVIGIADTADQGFYPQWTPGPIWVQHSLLNQVEPQTSETEKVVGLRLDDNSAVATGQVVQTIFNLYNGPAENSAVERYSTWQQVQDSMASNDRLVGLLLALFGIIALVAAPCAIANVTAGRVLVQRQDIAMLKALGFTPGQVVRMLVAEQTALGAVGAGLGLAMACDLQIAGTSARFGTGFAGVGYSGDFGGSWTLTRLVGTAKARELYFLGDVVDSATALSLGLVSRVVADEALRNETAALARRIADGPRIAYGYMKRNLFAAETEPLAAVLELEALHQARTAMTEDHLEASRAFVEKRRPVFKGR